MAADTDSSNYTGFLEVEPGLPAAEAIKSSLSPYGPLKNILRIAKSIDRTTNQVVTVVECYCPSVTLTGSSDAALIVGKGYANLPIGSIIRCANGLAYKTAAPGTDTWKIQVIAGN